MWQLGITIFIIRCSYFVFGRSQPIELVKCYDCNYAPSGFVGQNSTNFTEVGYLRCALGNDDDNDLVAKTDCTSGKCFIRLDPNGLVYRGCANPWNLPLDVDVNKQCEYQGEGDWRPLWWFCDGNLCNDEQLGGSDETCGDYSGTLTSEDLLDVIGAKESKTIGASGQGQNQFKTTGATGQVQSQFKTTGASGQGQLFNGQNTDQNIYQITTADGGTTADKDGRRATASNVELGVSVSSDNMQSKTDLQISILFYLSHSSTTGLASSSSSSLLSSATVESDLAASNYYDNHETYFTDKLGDSHNKDDNDNEVDNNDDDNYNDASSASSSDTNDIKNNIFNRDNENITIYALSCTGDCHRNPSGLHVDPFNNTRFIQCGIGIKNDDAQLACTCCRPYRMRCPLNTFFDDVAKVCVTPFTNYYNTPQQ